MECPGRAARSGARLPESIRPPMSSPVNPPAEPRQPATRVTGSGLLPVPAHATTPAHPSEPASRSSWPPKFDDYQLLSTKPIGEGSRGTVFRAKDRSTDEEVAIKVFSEQSRLDQSMRMEVDKQIEAHRSVSGFISVKKCRFDANPPYYVMPFYKEGSLQNRIDKKSLTVDDAVQLFTTIVRSMASIHQKGLIHGDLKPANILLNDSGEPLISDFGLGQLWQPRAGAFGTRYYMPPEQAEAGGTRGDLRWDVYALGATLYSMVSGDVPRHNSRMQNLLSQSQSTEEVIRVYKEELQNTPLVPLRKKAPGVDPALSRIVDHCLSLDPARRPRDAGDLLDQLRRRERWLRIRPQLVLMALVTAVVLVVAVVAARSYETAFVEESTRDAKNIARVSLRHHAWIGNELLSEKIGDRIHFIEHEAAEGMKNPELMASFARLADHYRAHPPVGLYRPFNADERQLLKPFSDWIAELHERANDRLPTAHTRRLALQIVVDGYSYVVAIIKVKNGKEAIDWPLPENASLYQTNLSWNDYFNGKGSQYDKPNEKFWPIGHTHVSQVYESQIDHSSRMGIVTPIRYPDKEGASDAKPKIVGLLSIGIDIDKDLIKWLNPDAQVGTTPNDNAKSNEELLLINDRGCLAYHSGLATVNVNGKDPEPLYKDVSWFKEKKSDFQEYDDPVALADKPAACWAYCQPINLKLKGQADPKAPPIEKQWMLVAQVRQEFAEQPVYKLRDRFRTIAMVVLAVFLTTVVILWTALIRVLLRQGRATHV
jgi:eukaryotic-like serine/threonine-protein kinase